MTPREFKRTIARLNRERDKAMLAALDNLQKARDKIQQAHDLTSLQLAKHRAAELRKK